MPPKSCIAVPLVNCLLDYIDVQRDVCHHSLGPCLDSSVLWNQVFRLLFNYLAPHPWHQCPTLYLCSTCTISFLFFQCEAKLVLGTGCPGTFAIASFASNRSFYTGVVSHFNPLFYYIIFMETSSSSKGSLSVDELRLFNLKAFKRMEHSSVDGAANYQKNLYLYSVY